MKAVKLRRFSELDRGAQGRHLIDGNIIVEALRAVCTEFFGAL